MAYGFRGPIRAIGIRRRKPLGVPSPYSGNSFVDAAMELARVRTEMLQNEKQRQDEHDKNEAARQAAHEAKLRELDGVISTGRARISALRAPAKGEPGRGADERAIEERLLARIPAPKNGEDADPEEVAKIVMDMMAAEKDEPVDMGQLVAQVIKEIADKKVLRPEHVQGLADDLKRFQSQLKPGMGYVHGGGITRLTAGTNITITKLTDGSYRITAAGGGGFTVLAATETPNGVRTVFTFAGASAQPSYIRVDGALTKATSASGTVNWTWNNATKKATLTVPAQDDIDAIV